MRFILAALSIGRYIYRPMNNPPCFPQWQARLAPVASGPNSRQRRFSLPVTFWVFLWQCFQPDRCCRAAVQQLRASLCGADPVVSLAEDSSAYCQARHRLPLERLAALCQDAAAAAQQQAPPFAWCGHPVKIVDGSTASLPDTAANQKDYPQPRSQQPGCGFPLLKYVALFCLGSGALLGWQPGNKHQHELHLFQKLWDQVLHAGDVVLGDRGFSSYVTLACLQARRSGACFVCTNTGRTTCGAANGSDPTTGSVYGNARRNGPHICRGHCGRWCRRN